MILVANGLGCAVTASGVRERYENDFTCPSVRVVERPDVDPLKYVDALAGTPRDEIRNNPARYAFWRERTMKIYRVVLDGRTTYEVSGCGEHRLGFCASGRNGAASCLWTVLPPGDPTPPPQ